MTAKSCARPSGARCRPLLDAQDRAQLLYDTTRAGYDGIKFDAVSENERLSAGKVSDEALSHQDRVDVQRDACSQNQRDWPGTGQTPRTAPVLLAIRW